MSEPKPSEVSHPWPAIPGWPIVLLLAAVLVLAAGASSVRAAGTGPGQSVVDPTPGGPELLGLVYTGAFQTCTGFVIAPDTVLTAAHCVCTETWATPRICSDGAGQIFLPDPAAPDRLSPYVYGSVTVHPDYNPSFFAQQIEHDFAIIKLYGVAPAYAKPFIVSGSYPARGSHVLVAGLGFTGPDCNIRPDGPKSQVAPVDDYEDGHDIMRFDDQRICPVDDGGPILSLDGSHVFGVNSATFWTLNDGSVDKSCTTGSVFDWIKSFMCHSSPTNRCDGDGDVCNCTAGSDILWRGPDGQVSIWAMNGRDVVRTTSPGGPDPGLLWQIQGSGDFNGDGQADILWRHSGGQVAIWFMSGGEFAGAAYPGGPDPGLTWRIQGVGDFDGDGRADILWRHVGGQLAIWFEGDRNHDAYPGYSNYPWPVPNSFLVRGVGDFDGDGDADILWQEDTGAVAIWLMDGATRVGESYPAWPDPSPGWSIRAVGDFDGNLRSDILWTRAQDGRLAIWFDGKVVRDGVPQERTYLAFPTYQNTPPGPIDPAWQVQAVGDFDHDGRDDLLWRHTGGTVAIWLMNGARFVGDIYPPARDPSQKVQGLMHDANF